MKNRRIKFRTISAKGVLLMFCFITAMKIDLALAQEGPKAEDPTNPVPLALYLNKDKTKYLWINFLTQMETNFRDNQAQFNLKRSQFFMSARVSNTIMLSTYFTTGNLDASNLEPSAQGNGNQVSLNGLYMDIDVIPGKLRLGGGLHYVNGISRLTNYSAFTSMTYDAPGGAFLGDGFYPSWWGYGYSDQFSSPLGIYAIGDFGRFHYQVSVNNSMVNTFASGSEGNDITTNYTYQGNYYYKKFNDGRASMNYQGYFEYQFLDKEWHEYTFRRGTYFGQKSVFNLGAGFFYQPNALVRSTESTPLTPSSITEAVLTSNKVSTTNALSFAVDAFYDAPLGKGALNAYLAYYRNDFGEKGAVYGTGTGNILYGQLGYMLPLNTSRTKVMPYFSYLHQDFEHTPNTSFESTFGCNFFFYEHKLKLTPEYVFGRKGANGAQTNGYFRVLLTMSL